MLHDGAVLNANELIEWSREHLAGFKCPRSVSFVAVDDVPRNATGKVLHRVLKEQVLESERTAKADQRAAS